MNEALSALVILAGVLLSFATFIAILAVIAAKVVKYDDKWEEIPTNLVREARQIMLSMTEEPSQLDDMDILTTKTQLRIKEWLEKSRKVIK